MKIIAAVDGSPHSEFAVELVTRLKLPKSTEVILLSVAEELEIGTFSESLRDYIAQSVREKQVREAKSLLQLETRKLAPHFIPIRAELRDGHVADQIINFAEEERADLVVLGARGLNAVERFFLGSTSEKVSKYARCSVLIGHKPAEAETPEEDAAAQAASVEESGKLRILVCCDGSRASNEAIESLARLPLGSQAEIMLLSVHSLMTLFRKDVLQKMSDEWHREKQQAEEALTRSAEHLKASGLPNVSVRVREADDVSTEILALARSWSADLIMVGSTGRSAIDRFLLGSVSKRIARHSPCSVWIARHAPVQ